MMSNISPDKNFTANGELFLPVLFFRVSGTPCDGQVSCKFLRCLHGRLSVSPPALPCFAEPSRTPQQIFHSIGCLDVNQSLIACSARTTPLCFLIEPHFEASLQSLMIAILRRDRLKAHRTAISYIQLFALWPSTDIQRPL